MAQQNNSPEANKKVVQTFVEECWNQGNLNKVSEFLTEQAHFHDAVFPNLNPGLQNIKNHIEACRRAFPDLKYTIDDTIAERNEVVTHWRISGTHKGQFLGMPPTNRKVSIDGTSIYRIEGARIAEAHANWNLASMMQQIGVMEIPAEARVESRHDARQEKSEAWQELKSHA
ncbi:MAG: ester cyclase [Terracidiphilus sp.]|jgi:steroid delta-isomerase-like uncharacterized protein